MLRLIVAMAMQLAVTPATTPRATEDQVFAEINRYRVARGLRAIARSPSLDFVARAHADDLAAHRPDMMTDPSGRACNMHSWSARGRWTPVCYTADHAQAKLMWSKPRELTDGRYPGNGYEIASGWSGRGVVPVAVSIAGWKASGGHNAVIVEEGIWKGKNWRAIGVGAAPGYTVVWFGAEPDTAVR